MAICGTGMFHIQCHFLISNELVEVQHLQAVPINGGALISSSGDLDCDFQHSWIDTWARQTGWWAQAGIGPGTWKMNPKNDKLWSGWEHEITNLLLLFQSTTNETKPTPRRRKWHRKKWENQSCVLHWANPREERIPRIPSKRFDLPQERQSSFHIRVLGRGKSPLNSSSSSASTLGDLIKKGNSQIQEVFLQLHFNLTEHSQQTWGRLILGSVPGHRDVTLGDTGQRWGNGWTPWSHRTFPTPMIPW